MTVSIILPTYNEVENIIPLIRAIEKSVNVRKEIIVVDDNSPDGTSQAVRQYIKKRKTKTVRLETRYTDRGLTNSIKRGIELSRGDVVVWMDCDFSMPPSVIPKLLAKISDGYDIAVGSRFVPGGAAKHESVHDSWIGIALSNFLNFWMQRLLGGKFHDYTSGFVAVRKDVFETVTLRGDYGEYFIDFIVHSYRQGFRVVEVPYVCEERRAGESKTGQHLGDYVWRGRKYVQTVFRLLLEPIFPSL